MLIPGGISKYDTRVALNLMFNNQGVKHLAYSDGKFEPTHGIIGIIPWNGVSVKITAETIHGDDIPEGFCYNTLYLPIKSVTVSDGGGECLAILVDPNDI